jgi:hypothetical protein
MIIYNSFRGITFASLIVVGLGILVIVNNSKEKKEYIKATGQIEYYAKEFNNLPLRHKGDFRYLKIDNYPFIFEIYEPNNQVLDKSIDDFQVGNTIEIYYYETANTAKEKINRHVQFIDFNGKAYFIRNAFQKQMGFAIVGIGLLTALMAYLFWKKRKLNW